MTAQSTAGTTPPSRTAGSMPEGAQRLDIRVGELRQLFNSMDPSPFRERDLDPAAENYIVEWASELRGQASLALVVHAKREPASRDEEAALQQAVHDFFGRGAAAARVRLKRLFRRGRLNLLIGILFVAAANLIGDLAAELLGAGRYGRLIQESFAIGAWVALWRPIEIFLYDWWPIRAEAKLLDRLSEMHVSVVEATATSTAAAAAGVTA